MVLPICIIALLLIYLVKYWVLKFAGWITRAQGTNGDLYFIVFLVNKMIVLALVPLVIVMSFHSEDWISGGIVIVRVVVIGSMLLMRFFRSLWIAPALSGSVVFISSLHHQH